MKRKDKKKDQESKMMLRIYFPKYIQSLCTPYGMNLTMIILDK